MTATILNGKELAHDIRKEITRKVQDLITLTGVQPGLGVVLIGDNPASQSYVTAKEKACAEAGILSQDIRLPATLTQNELIDVVKRLNDSPEIHGILVQLPLPRGFDEDEVIRTIAPKKDVDGFTPENVGRMLIGQACFLPCTPHGILKLLQRANVVTTGKHVVVIGRSNIVGRPIANLLSQKRPEGNATVTLCHSATQDLISYTRQADIVIVATGCPNTLTGDMIKPGAVVIDVGVNRVLDDSAQKGYRLCGDVDFESLLPIAGMITPVPGGVGPMTITMLLENTYISACRAAGVQAQ